MSQPTDSPRSLTECTVAVLDHRAARAESLMNRALEQRRWNAVRYHREVVLAVQAEYQRRLAALDDVDVPVCSGQGG
jgi:hypothetical protein